MAKTAKQLTLQQAIDLCLLDAENERAKSTARNYHNALNIFCKFLEDYVTPLPRNSMLSELGVEHFIRFPAWMSRAGDWAFPSILMYMSGAKYFFDWLILNDYLEPSQKEILQYKKATEGITRKRTDRKPRKPKDGDAELVRTAAYQMPVITARHNSQNDRIQKGLEHLRNIALIELLYSSGCRNFEAAGLSVKHFDFDKRRAEIIGKGTGGNRTELIYFSTECAEALTEYWKERKWVNPDAPAFARHDRASTNEKPLGISPRTIHKIVIACAKFAGLEAAAFHPHSFRHAFVIRILRETGNLAMAQDLARHKSTDTTRLYSVLEEEEKMAAHHRIFQ